jgi:putative DNA primase/helicase
LDLYNKGEKLFLSPEAEHLAKIEQREHSQADDRQGIVEEYLEALLPVGWGELDIHDRRAFLVEPLAPRGVESRMFVCIAEIWCECLNKEKSDMSRYNTREINEILRGLEGWEQCNSTKNFALYGKQKYYSRKLF